MMKKMMKKANETMEEKIEKYGKNKWMVTVPLREIRDAYIPSGRDIMPDDALNSLFKEWEPTGVSWSVVYTGTNEHLVPPSSLRDDGTALMFAFVIITYHDIPEQVFGELFDDYHATPLYMDAHEALGSIYA